MKILVKAKPGSKKPGVRNVGGLFDSGSKIPEFIVAVKEPAQEGKANRAIEAALAEYFHVAPSRVRIVSGHAAKTKVIEIDDD